MLTHSTNELTFGDINVIDGAMPPALHDELSSFFSEPIWFYGWKSNAKKGHAPNSH